MEIQTIGGPIVGVIIGWILATVTRHFDEVLFGARLKITCPSPGNKDETPDDLFIRFRVTNETKRRVAKRCRVYLVAVYKVSNNRVISANLISDTFQLPWAGCDFEERNIPALVSQYVDLVHFSKHESGWKFMTKPGFYPSMTTLGQHRGTYRFTVLAAGDGAPPKIKEIHVDYDGDWKNATPYE